MTDFAILFHILQAITSGISLRESFEITSNISRLNNSHLNVAIDILNQAKISETESKSLLADAIGEFTRALKLEKEENKIISYFGLALCYKFMNDTNNTKKILLRLLKDDFWSEVNKLRDWANEPYEPLLLEGVGGVAMELAHRSRHRRIKNLIELEKQIKITINEL